MKKNKNGFIIQSEADLKRKKKEREERKERQRYSPIDKGADVIKKRNVTHLYEFEKRGKRGSGFIKSTVLTPFRKDRKQLREQGYKFKGILKVKKREELNSYE